MSATSRGRRLTITGRCSAACRAAVRARGRRRSYVTTLTLREAQPVKYPLEPLEEFYAVTQVPTATKMLRVTVTVSDARGHPRRTGATLRPARTALGRYSASSPQWR